ncbi:MAG: ATP phosphoribosyltransferase regulatory subunit [Bacteroidales bacterium]|nr:ATP phosphoribosyltransferase regulatory subunit [Clostridium sp.]MCM1204679.1 ATP phosphoribosyltransferase regulatory subunit [Bacteroidales bacterium]
MEKLLHTPEGVRDIYDNECRKKRKVLHKMHHVLSLYSYHDIETPTFEFFDIFNQDKGSATSNEMYKFFDRENNTLVLRPDITPSIARCVAKYYPDEELPIRLCYQGNTFFNTHNHQGKLNEITQLGAELINDDSSAADAEVIATVIDCFLAAGLTEFQIEIGEVDFFKGILEEAELDKGTVDEIRNYIHNRNFFGLESLIKELDLKENVKKVLLSFDQLFGGYEMLEKAKELVTNSTSTEAIRRLEKVYTALSYSGYEKYISFDFSLLSRYEYYTGIMFRGYTYGTGDAVVKGGRYNNLLGQYGKEAPAIGFAFYIDDLMMAISRQKIEIPVDNSDSIILYDIEKQKTAIRLANHLRKSGRKVELIRKSKKKEVRDYAAYGKKNRFSGMFYLTSDTMVDVYDFVSEEISSALIEDIEFCG